jgi:transcription factor C subunit 6
VTTKAKTASKPKPGAVGTGVWPRQVGVHRVTWNCTNGLAAAGLLASATASGLCRVDELWGRWMKDKVPYLGVEHIRVEMEDADAMDVDSDESAASD